MTPYRASCLCGRIVIEVRGGVSQIIHCHCSRCRKASGTAYATNGFIQTAGLTFVSGKELLHAWEASPGRRRHFCSVCGSPLYNSNDADPARLRLRLGLLDSDIAERPGSHIFVSSKASWEDLDAVLPRYDGQEPGRT